MVQNENETSDRKVRRLSAEQLDKATYLRVFINGKAIDCLLHTGNETCIFLAGLIERDRLTQVDQRLFAANGTIIGVPEIARVTLQIGDGRYTVDGFVSDQITEMIFVLTFCVFRRLCGTLVRHHNTRWSDP